MPTASARDRAAPPSRARLALAGPPPLLEQLRVSTIHGLCSILRENAIAAIDPSSPSGRAGADLLKREALAQTLATWRRTTLRPWPSWALAPDLEAELESSRQGTVIRLFARARVRPLAGRRGGDAPGRVG